MSNVKDFRFLLYKVEQEDVIVKAFIQNETLWLTQKSMAELFGVKLLPKRRKRMRKKNLLSIQLLRFLQQFKMKEKGKSHAI